MICHKILPKYRYELNRQHFTDKTQYMYTSATHHLNVYVGRPAPQHLNGRRMASRQLKCVVSKLCDGITFCFWTPLVHTRAPSVQFVSVASSDFGMPLVCFSTRLLSSTLVSQKEQ